jgi:hypothetical protein
MVVIMEIKYTNDIEDEYNKGLLKSNIKWVRVDDEIRAWKELLKYIPNNNKQWESKIRIIIKHNINEFERS